MHFDLISLLQHLGLAFGWLGVAALGLAGLGLSCLSLSGTWLVVLGTVLAAFLSGAGFPGWGTVLGFIVLAGLVEVGEFFSSVWGVKKRGGSNWAGFAALAGGILGLFLGAFIPIPLVGSLIGMMLGSFSLVYLVEKQRLKKDAPAVHIAFGAVVARVLVVLLKVGATLGMLAFLGFGLLGGGD